MRTEFGYAWGKLYLATVELACSDASLPRRVERVYRIHLASLNSQNLPMAGYERLKNIRSRFARVSDNPDEEDATINLTPLSPADAASIAEDIVSMYDEVASRRSAEARTASPAG